MLHQLKKTFFSDNKAFLTSNVIAAWCALIVVVFFSMIFAREDVFVFLTFTPCFLCVRQWVQ